MAVGPITLENVDIPLVIAGVSTLIVAAAWFARWNAKPTNAANEPPLLPGGLPILGHALTFGKDSSKIFQYAKDWSTNDKPVSISLMGQRIYVVLNPRDWSAIYRAKTLPFEPMVQWALPTMFGMTQDGTDKCDLDPDGQGSLFINQHHFFRDALGPGDNLTTITTAFLKYLKEDVARVYSEVKAAPNSEMTIDLFKWVRVIMGIASTNAMLGPNLLKNEPDVLDRLWQFEKDYFTFTYGLPKWMLSKAYKNRRLMIESFGRNIRDKKALWFVGIREEMMALRGMSDYDVGAGTFSVWAALQANANPTTFWLLHFILFMPGCRDKILEEITPAFNDQKELVDLDHLVNKTPLLNSIYWETMRWTSGVNSVRKVVEDTVIAGYTFLNDGVVMMPGRPNHFDPKIFGDDAHEYVPERFMRDVTNMPGKKNPGIKAVRPFGGGNTLCPGRFFASNEIMAFVATVMLTFDFEILPGQKMARSATHLPTVGTYAPTHDIKVKLKLRQ